MAIDYSLDKTPPNQMTSKKYARNDEWTKAFIMRCQVGHVGSHWDDQPFITPILYWYDPEKHKIYFHTSLKGRLAANCARDNKVCFEASEMGQMISADSACKLDVQYGSVVVFGKMNLVENDEEKKHALYGLIEKHFPEKKWGIDDLPMPQKDLDRTAVYAINIESWSGKCNWDEAAS